MAEDTDAPGTTVRTEVQPPRLTCTDVPHAPIVFFDEAPTSAAYNGIITVTLGALRDIPDGSERIPRDWIVTGYLRCNIPAALALRTALDNALLAAAPTPTEAKN